MTKRKSNQQGIGLEVWEIKQYGRMKLNTRKRDEYYFPVWTAVQDCEDQHCIAVDFCPVDPKIRVGRKCLIMTHYLKQAEDNVYNALGKDATEFDLYKVGMHLIPLYKQFARLKIVEMTVTSRSIAEETKSGTTKIHGVFKELREINTAILKAFYDLGVGRKRVEHPDLPLKPVVGYYEKMEKDAKKEGKSLKLVKRNEQTG